MAAVTYAAGGPSGRLIYPYLADSYGQEKLGGSEPRAFPPTSLRPTAVGFGVQAGWKGTL